MKHFILSAVFSLFATMSVAGPQYVDRTGYAVSGYDVVAYFPEFGGAATLGLDEFSLDYEGLTYKFSSQVNLDEFLNNPDRYEPAHGGFCSYAMSVGSSGVDINPRSFIIEGDRLLLFATGTKSRWLQNDQLEQEEDADLVWEDKSQNLSNFADKIGKLNDDVDIIVLPEMFSTGFTMTPAPMAARPRLRWRVVRVGAMAEISAESPKIASPMANTRRRPIVPVSETRSGDRIA